MYSAIGEAAKSAKPVETSPACERSHIPTDGPIIIEGDATNVVLGAGGDHFVVPRVDGSYSYTITWSPAKKC